MGEIQKGKLFFEGEIPQQVISILNKHNLFYDGGAVRVKRGGKEVVVEELFLAGEEEEVNKAWEEIYNLPECLKDVELFTKEEIDRRYTPVFNMIIESMKRGKEND